MNKKILGLTLAAAFTAGTANATIVLDNFNAGGVVTSFNAPILTPISDSELGTADSISTNRTLTSNITVQGGSNFLDSSVNEAGAIGVPNVLSFSLGAGVNGNTTLDWGTFAATDFTEAGIANAIRFILPSMDLIGTTLTLTLGDGVATDSVAFVTDIDTLTAAALGDAPIDFLLSDFAVNSMAITNAMFRVDGVENLDLTVDSVGTVCSGGTGNGTPGSCTPVTAPEPTSIALLGMGLVALGFRRRKVK